MESATVTDSGNKPFTGPNKCSDVIHDVFLKTKLKFHLQILNLLAIPLYCFAPNLHVSFQGSISHVLIQQVAWEINMFTPSFIFTDRISAVGPLIACWINMCIRCIQIFCFTIFVNVFSLTWACFLCLCDKGTFFWVSTFIHTDRQHFLQFPLSLNFNL